MYNIKKSPQYDLYRLTKKLFLNKDKLVPKNADNRCIDSTIINRAYYSSYLLAEEWLRDKFNFKVKHPLDFDNGEKVISEHEQIKFELIRHCYKAGDYLYKLGKLRIKADYNPFMDLTDQEVSISIKLLDSIFDNLKFNWGVNLQKTEHIEVFTSLDNPLLNSADYVGKNSKVSFEKAKNIFLKEFKRLSREFELGDVSFFIDYESGTAENVFLIKVPKNESYDELLMHHSKIRAHMKDFAKKHDLCFFLRNIFIVLDY